MRAPARTEGLLLTGLLDDLRRIVRVLRESSRASEGRLGVAGAQLFVLKSLSSSEPLCLNDVAVLTRTHQSTASVVIERLVERGLVQRLELSPARRRVLAETLHELVAANDARLPVAPSLGPALAAAHMSPRRVLVDGRVVAISGISVAIALTAGFVAQALTALIGLFTNLAFYGRLSTAFVSPTAHRLGPLVVAVPVAGGLVVGLMARYGSQAIRGHGIPDAMEQVLVPVSAVLLAVEPLLLEYRPRSLIPVALAAAAATAVRIAFVGAEPAFAMPELQQPGGAALACYALIGALLGVASAGVTRAVYAIEDGFARLPIHWMFWPAEGARAGARGGCEDRSARRHGRALRRRFARAAGFGRVRVRDHTPADRTLAAALRLCRGLSRVVLADAQLDHDGEDRAAGCAPSASMPPTTSSAPACARWGCATW